jgi:transglutaminase-like putative cysteine protease/tetratricopeptide (TPR) repeat protein
MLHVMIYSLVDNRRRSFAACVTWLSFFFLVPCLVSGDGQRWSMPRFSEDAKAVYEAASSVAAPAGAEALVLEEEQNYFFYPDGRANRTHYFVYKILTQNGVDHWGGIFVTWEPWHEERPRIRARVITPDNATHLLDPNAITDAPARETEADLYSNRRVVRAPLPAIAPGSLVEAEETSSETTPLFSAGVVSRFYFGAFVPVLRSSLSLNAPASLPIRFDVQLLPGLKPERQEADGRAQIVFDYGPMDGWAPAESYLPSYAHPYPNVTFSTGRSWQSVAEEYGKIVDRQIAQADVKSVVATLVAGKASRQDKAAAILQYLSREVRYTGVEFDEASIFPHSPSETLKNKYGDCKDKATLLVAMLRAAGIDSHVALVNAGEREDVPSDLPGLGRFDHVIVYAPGNPDLWIDPTDSHARLGQLPAADQGRLALVVNPASHSLVTTKVTSSLDNLVLETREVHLSENGPAVVTETTEPRGSVESWYRAVYADPKNEERRKGLEQYVKSEYLAEKLDAANRSDPDDLSKPFQLLLKASGARRGYSDLDSAVVAIRLGSLFGRLPRELQEREPEENKNSEAQGEKPGRVRKADFQLPEAFVTEWRYRITPPRGFQPKPLPPNTKVSLGPATLLEEFSADPDGVVQAVLRFDTVRRQFSAAEATEMRDRVAQLRESEAILIYFEPVALALLNEGKIRDAFQAYHALISLHPNEAIHHLQIANAFLHVGLGQAARDEARLAVKLEPNSALSQKTLAHILEYDVVDRQFRRGSDYAGAEAAFRAAKKLDPDDEVIPANLAILLEYNAEGERYGPGAKLKEAVAEYRLLKPDQLARLGVQNNLAFALVYAGEFAEARQYAESLNPQLAPVIVAAEAAQNGPQAGIAEARKRTGAEEESKPILMAAGQILMRLRRYAAAADLFEAGASGGNAANTMAFAAMVRKARPRENLQFQDDAAGTVLWLFAALTDAKPLALEKILAVSSRNAQAVINKTDPEEVEQSLRVGRELRRMFSQKDLPPDAMMDVVLQALELRAEGDDARGYRITLRGPGSANWTMYVVKEKGRYRILDSSEKPNSIALEALDRINTGNLASARVLLDWVREEQHLAGGDDPLAGYAFPRIWTKGKDADAAQMKLAAAAILSQTGPTAEKAASLLESLRDSAKNETDKLNLSLALLDAYASLEQYEKLLGLSGELLKQYPDSKRAFFDEQRALLGLGRYDDAEARAQERLKRLPGDLDAMRSLVWSAVAREDYALAHERGQKIVASGKAEAGDLNNLAWHALFTGKVGEEDLLVATKAAQLNPNAAHILHTLGCVYAEVGKTREAREVLIQAMDMLNLDEPDSNYWYAFGRIAERYGEREVASSDYSRVAKPKKTIQIPDSSYRLAQNRLKLLGAASEIVIPPGSAQGRQ